MTTLSIQHINRLKAAINELATALNETCAELNSNGHDIVDISDQFLQAAKPFLNCNVTDKPDISWDEATNILHDLEKALDKLAIFMQARKTKTEHIPPPQYGEHLLHKDVIPWVRKITSLLQGPDLNLSPS